MRALMGSFWRNEEGATAVEYGLIVAVLSLVVVGGVGMAADAIQFLFGNTNSSLVQAFK
ncbi:MAG: Flp family type IVb pilin [Rhizobiaceae bacterium]